MSKRKPRAAPRQKSGSHPFFVALVMLSGIGGALAAVFCIMWLLDIWSISQQQEMLRTLPDAAKATPGEPAILDGRIAASVPTRHGEFVAFIRESRQREWRLVNQATPPLDVETASGSTMAIANSDYRFDRLLVDWTDSMRDDAPPTFSVGGIRIQGLVAGGPVMAFGRLMRADDGRLTFHADSVVGHTRATYFERLVEWRSSVRQLVGASAALAVLGLYLGWRGVRRVMRD